jgi:exodeoxyribonuclease VII small subunit
MNFESKIKKLEELVKKLETPDVGIDAGVKLFDEGIKLSKECYEILNTNKGEINIITKDLNEAREKPFKK